MEDNHVSRMEIDHNIITKLPCHATIIMDTFDPKWLKAKMEANRICTILIIAKGILVSKYEVYKDEDDTLYYNPVYLYADKGIKYV